MLLYLSLRSIRGFSPFMEADTTRLLLVIICKYRVSVSMYARKCRIVSVTTMEALIFRYRNR